MHPKVSCSECHETRYGEMTDGWQKEISEQMRELKRSLEDLRVRKKGIPEAEGRKIETLTKEVEGALKAMAEDKSKGVHNFTYAKRLISEAEKKILITKKSIPKKLE